MKNEPKDYKVLRDPIYGYISIPIHIFDTIIDRAAFQRLRSIRQTSYEPLYSAALHNRFTHSIGVYHLGCIAFESLKKSVETFDCFAEELKMIGEAKWERLECVFTTACLLHDVGHAPFSHTGEDAFKACAPEKSLMAEIDSEEFKKGITQKSAAPHEFMSAYVALKAFPEIFAGNDSTEDPEERKARIKAEKELFARCIIGHPYIPEEMPDGELVPLPPELALKNCLISLLNSTIIDVDRLDYVIRDSYVSGFQNMSIDYQRLLNSVCVARRDGRYQLAYHKNALSIIENVIFACDAEKKWIQNHPVVLYEHFLVQHAIEVVQDYYVGLRATKNGEVPVPVEPGLFSYESLSTEGNLFNADLKISLLSDDDIIYSIKNIPACKTKLTQEYFSRTDRRHAVWKSEAEFRALFEQALGSGALNALDKLFERIDRQLRNIDYQKLPIINDDFLKYCIEQKEGLERGELSEGDAKESLAFFCQTIPMLTDIKKYMEENDFQFDLVYVSAKQFHSTFAKSGISDILVHYPKFKRVYRIHEISTTLNTGRGRDSFFYLFYSRRTKAGEKTDKKIKVLPFSGVLCTNILQVYNRDTVSA